MSIANAYVGARIIEAVENYEKSDQPEVKPGESAVNSPPLSVFKDDESFWMLSQSDPDLLWNKKVTLIRPVLSEWVARVPGLFYAKGSRNLRVEFNGYEKNITGLGHSMVTFKPATKSMKVLGGIGTLRLPPDINGYRMVTFSMGRNPYASSGIPALIHSDVWDAHKLEEGTQVKEVNGKWKEMTTEWASRFPILKNIRKGVLLIDKPEQITEVTEKGAPIKTSPFSIMEYTNTDTGIKLYDFVFASADSGHENFRKNMETFFENYRQRNNRIGRYLTTADISNPMWDAEYNTPQDLRRQEPSGESHLNLILERVRKSMFKDKTIEEVLKLTIEKYDSKERLFTLAQDIDMKKTTWYNGGALTDAGADLINACIARKKMEELIDAIALDYPHIIGS